MQYQSLQIERTGHSGFLIKGSKIVYFDPFQLRTLQRADIIFISHSHYDHCSFADVKQISDEKTIIVTVPDCLSKLADAKKKDILLIAPGQSKEVGDILVEAVPAYNINKQFHPKENDWLGFIVTIDNVRIYHAGDTDLIPEMKTIQNIDIALLPVSGTFTMTPDEAAKAAGMIQPKLAVPMHYGSGVAGSQNDAARFKSLAKCPVEIL